MIRFVRPLEPADFQARTAETRASVADAIQAGRDPEFPSLWGDYKDHFVAAQRRKCAYCEAKVSDSGQIDHYRPKREVADLPTDSASLGREVGPNRFRGRRAGRTWRGYHFRAYDWANYVFVCGTCNRVKGVFFPIVGGHSAAPDVNTSEEPLLIHPFEEPQPWRHFVFHELGQIAPAPGSAKGEATIATCWLDRDPLRDDRCRVLMQVVKFLDAFDEHPLFPESLLDLADDEAPHAGAVRSVIERAFGAPWEECEELLKSSLDGNRRPGGLQSPHEEGRGSA